MVGWNICNIITEDSLETYFTFEPFAYNFAYNIIVFPVIFLALIDSFKTILVLTAIAFSAACAALLTAATTLSYKRFLCWRPEDMASFESHGVLYSIISTKIIGPKYMLWFSISE